MFVDALPRDPRVSTLKMFGGVAGIVNGHMFGGLFGRSFMVKLSETDQKAALALDGAEPFDPMGTGAVMKDSIFMPEAVMDDGAELRDWLRRALQYTATLPPKVKKSKDAAKAKPAAIVRAKPKAKAKPATKGKATAKVKPKRPTARPRR